ncbi:amidohydrolase [Saxibacter everestensis]|uniref:Amidohydrolase n=1 Tax=Saxibacter everestensis TaxID=2909229 RepID=A0ABY8QSC6_9MICO|nr:amidohydrolase [Brevibacteriaceae bacterium ZFBP1038]
MATADLIITNARIYTVDAASPWAEALAVRDGRLLAVGSETDVAAFRGPGTIEHVLDGAFVMPGLIDVHNHHAVAGKADLFELGFSANAGYQEILQAVEKHAAKLPEDAWVTGGSWGSTLMEELSTEQARHGLDQAAGGRPVMLSDDSHHNRWVSTRALELAGITAESDPGEGGIVVLDGVTGRPTGVLLEAAGIPVEQAKAASAALTAEQHRLASHRGIEILSSYGITAIQDAAVSVDILGALKSLDTAGELNAWVVSSMLVNDQIFGFQPTGDALLAQANNFRSIHHRPDFVKIFLDGVPPARTGAFLEPYLPDDAHGAHFCGETTMPADQLLDWLRRTAEQGLSAKIHCTGDASARMVLDAVEVIRQEGFTAARYQIAHGQFVHEDDVPRFAALSVSADISPFLWVPGVIPQAIATALPAGIASKLQPNRDLLDSGALVAGGSDWPVSESPNAWEGIQGLVTRMDPTGQFPGQLWPEQAITLEEAIAVFTINAAEAMGLGEITGSLSSGKSADFVVLDRNPFDIDISSVASLRAEQTWFAGRKVFERATAMDRATASDRATAMPAD